MEAPQGQDFLQTFAEVDGLIRRERPALPTVGWIPWPVDGRQLGAHVKPLITKINALKREIEEPISCQALKSMSFITISIYHKKGNTYFDVYGCIMP